MTWKSEDIPEEDIVYMRAHKSVAKDGEICAGMFRDQGDSMSTNWQKYCPTAQACREMARVPTDNGVVFAKVGAIRAVPLTVAHTPVQKSQQRPDGDRSHTCVLGEKSTLIRLELMDIFEWAIRAPA